MLGGKMSKDNGKKGDPLDSDENAKRKDEDEYDDEEYKVNVNQKKYSYNNEEDDEDKYTRLNFTLPKEMKDAWKEFADDVSKSVSQLIRDGVTHYINEISREVGIQVPKTPKSPKAPKPPEPPIAPTPPQPPEFTPQRNELSAEDKDSLKRRIEGIIRIYHSIPIDKLANAMNVSVSEAENYIFEIVGMDIEGTIEEGVFYYQDDDSKVIYTFRQLINSLL